MNKYDKETLVKQLNEGLACLSDREKLVLTLKYFEDLTIDEISYILEITVFDVETYLLQAKQIMSRFTQIFEDIDAKDEFVSKSVKRGKLI